MLRLMTGSDVGWLAAAHACFLVWNGQYNFNMVRYDYYPMDPQPKAADFHHKCLGVEEHHTKATVAIKYGRSTVACRFCRRSMALR